MLGAFDYLEPVQKSKEEIVIEAEILTRAHIKALEEAAGTAKKADKKPRKYIIGKIHLKNKKGIAYLFQLQESGELVEIASIPINRHKPFKLLDDVDRLISETEREKAETFKLGIVPNSNQRFWIHTSLLKMTPKDGQMPHRVTCNGQEMVRVCFTL